MENINIEKLIPHKNNPRQDVGDIKELSESIKANGIMQNLTVVKNDLDDTYTVIIGHRRLAAAKLAGLTELPCQVVEMTEQQQAATMLLENMQRVDLTLSEQCSGIQMCIDLGMSVDDISNKTGLNKKTINKRCKISKLDKSVIDKPNVTIEDLLIMEEIESEEKRQKVEKYLGTPSFKYQAQLIIDLQNFEKDVKRLFKEAEQLGVKILKQFDYSTYSVIHYLYDIKNKSLKEIIGDENPADIVIYKGDGKDLKIARLRNKNEEQQKLRKQQMEEAEKERSLAKELRSKIDTMNDLIKRHLSKVIYEEKGSLKVWIALFMTQLEYNDFDNFFEENHISEDEMMESLNSAKTFEKFLHSDYCSIKFGEYIYTWVRRFNEQTLKDKLLQKFLESTGYEFSDEEKSLLNGTHELYKNDKDDE